MLDQNTDRMWYVIGAVIIGAAIILIMNKTFPQLFASVGETFIGKTEQTTEVVDGIMPNRKIIPFSMRDAEPWQTDMPYEWLSDTSIQFGPDDLYQGGIYIPTHYFELGKTYTIAFDVTKLSGDVPGIGGHLFITSGIDVTIDGVKPEVWSGGSKDPLNINDWSKSVVYPNDTAKHHIELTFTRNKSAEGGNVGNDEKFYIQPNRAGGVLNYMANALEYEVVIDDLQLYEHK